MIKVTPNDNLVPSTRDPWVRDHPYHDLTYNYVQARRLVRAASQFFHLRQGAVLYSGYLDERTSGPFTINLWHEGSLIRSLTLENLGYSGALHAETVGGDLAETVGWDLIGTLALDAEAELVSIAA